MEVEVKPALLAPLTLPRRSQAAQAESGAGGVPNLQNPRATHATRRDPSLESAFPACPPRRSTLVVVGKPALLAPLTLPWSASGKQRRGYPEPPTPPRNPRRGQRLSWNPKRSLTAKAFFLLDRARPVLFLGRQTGPPQEPSGAVPVGRGGARERAQFSPSGGNGVKRTLRRRQWGVHSRRQSRRHPRAASARTPRAGAGAPPQVFSLLMGSRIKSRRRA